MTTQRRDGNPPSEFSEWFRKQPEINSKLGFLNTNIDYCWRDYKSGYWMLIEEKRYKHLPPKWQMESFKVVDSSIGSSYYKGFHLIVFEKTSPNDGRLWLDTEEISKERLIDFLRFELPYVNYRSYFEKTKPRSVQH